VSEKYKIIIYQAADGLAKIEVRMDGETIWLNQAQIAQLYGRERSVITKHTQQANLFLLAPSPQTQHD